MIPKPPPPPENVDTPGFSEREAKFWGILGGVAIAALALLFGFRFMRAFL